MGVNWNQEASSCSIQQLQLYNNYRTASAITGEAYNQQVTQSHKMKECWVNSLCMLWEKKGSELKLKKYNHKSSLLNQREGLDTFYSAV